MPRGRDEARDGFPQTVSAVRSGNFAAILPMLALDDLSPGSCLIVQTVGLKPLTRKLALVWNPRVAHVRHGASKLIQQLRTELKTSTALS